jgi:hypothetical protein
LVRGIAGKTVEAETGKTAENAGNDVESVENEAEAEKEAEIGIDSVYAGNNAETGVEEDVEIAVGIEVRFGV